MITSLTTDQKKGIVEWREICLAIGRDTSPIDKKKTEKIWTEFYKILKYPKPDFVYCQSPLAAIRKIQKIIDKNEMIYTYSFCQHDIHLIGYLLFFKRYGLLPSDENFEIMEKWFELAKSCGWCYTFDTTVFVCEKPCKLFLNDKGQLHHDGAKALEYSDGYGLYMLNGVRVSKKIVMTPADSLDAQLIITEKNADVRRGIVRKIGIEQVCNKLNAKILEKGVDHAGQPCELLLLEINERPRPYIKLINPSTQTYDIEEVHPNCETLKDVWNSRNGT